MEGAPFQPWTAGTGEEAPVKREREERPLDAARVSSLQRTVENSLGAESRQRVAALVQQTELLSALERLLLYLKLPAGPAPQDPLKQPLNALGSRSEIQQTVTWIQTHLEVDAEVSLPKQDVYDEYIAYCMSTNMKPLSTADFGKVMKQVYPQVRPRRLGTRGNSRYCYAGLRKRIKLEVPQLPDLCEDKTQVASGSGDVKVETTNTADSGAERVVCEWAEGVLGVKLDCLSDLAAHLRAAPAPRAAAPHPAATPQPSPTRHAPAAAASAVAASLEHQPEDAPGQEGPSGAACRNPRQLLGQLKRKIQLQTASTPKKNKILEPLEMQTLSSLPPKMHPHDASERPYPYHGGFVPQYEPRAPYPSHPPMYREAYRPYLPSHSIPEAPYPAHLPINLSSDASSYPPTLDLSPPTRHEWPPERPPDPPQPPQPPPLMTHAPAKLPLPGKKMILEQYQNETQGGSPRHQPTRVEPSVDQQPHMYLPKKMRASESLGGKLSRQPDPLPRPPPPAEPTPQAAHSTQQPLTQYGQDFLGSPKNLAGRSKSIAAALVRGEQEAGTVVSRSPARGRPRRAGGGRGGRGRRRGSRVPSPGSCCGLDGINLKTGIICKENHTEILNRERVISICSLDKHALDDYLNEGSSQEHEEELMQYFQRETRDQPDNANNEKLSQLRELLAKNLKNQSGSKTQNVPMDDSSQDKAPDSTATVAFKPITGPHVSTVSENNIVMHQNQENTNRPPSSFDKRHSQQLVPNRMPGGPNCEFEEIPESPTTRMQQYDFVPISPTRRSPNNSNTSPVKRSTATDVGAPVNSPLSQSTQASPFVSPRDTPVPRSRMQTKPMPDKLIRKKNFTCGMTAVTSESCQRQISFAMPVDQKCMPKSPVYCSRMRHESRLPMSAPPSPNIMSSRYKTQFQLAPCPSNGSRNGFSTINYGMSNNSMYHDGTNGDCAPHSADPLSSEVSQFFHEPIVYDGGFQNEMSFRSQSVPLHKENGCRASVRQQFSYNNTPAGSVPPTPVPHEFCDFESLSETCEAVSKAGLNSESLDKIYNVLDSGAAANVLDSHRQLNSLLPTDPLIEKSQFEPAAAEINDLLKRSNSIELDLSDMGLVMDKNRFVSSRSVPSTPLPYIVGPAAPNGSEHGYGGQPSKSVPSTPLMEERGVFSYSNRDFLINGHALEAEAGLGLLELGKVGADGAALTGTEDLQDIDCLELPQLPTADLLAGLEPDHTYSDL